MKDSIKSIKLGTNDVELTHYAGPSFGTQGEMDLEVDNAGINVTLSKAQLEILVDFIYETTGIKA